jgi:hypothetical protein
MAPSEAELHPRAVLDQVALAYGLALRDILTVMGSNHGDKLPEDLSESSCSHWHLKELLASCSKMAEQIQMVHVSQPRRKRGLT